jgi:hypothetical protein
MTRRKRDWRWMCCECLTEGPGQEPEACPNCGAPDSWYMTADHGGRPLAEVLKNALGDYRVPPHLLPYLKRRDEN